MTGVTLINRDGWGMRPDGIWELRLGSPEPKVERESMPMKTMSCPKCGRKFHVGDNTLAVFCNVEHAMAADQQGLPAEDGLVYPIGWQAWLQSALSICAQLTQRITAQSIAAFHQHFVAKRSPADAVWLEFEVHL